MIRNEYSLDKIDRIFDFQLGQARSMLNPYNLKSGLFYQWLNDFEYVASVVGIPNHKMLDFFIMMVDNEIFQKIKYLLPHGKLFNFSYEQIVQQFHYYFSRPYHISLLHKTRFLIRYQYEKETIQQFVENLHKLYIKCEDVNPREYCLYSQFIRGIRDKEIRSALRKFCYITFEELVRLAIILERGKDTLTIP